MSDGTAMRDGALLWYRQTCRGGYGFQRRVPAVSLGYTGKRGRCAIEVLAKDGTRKRIFVSPSNVMPREHGLSIEWARR